VARAGSAKRYAQAVYQLAREKNEVEKWRFELRTIAETLSDPQLRTILEDPKVHLSEKEKLVSKCLPDMRQLALNFTYLLVAKERLGILEQIAAEYEQMADSYEGLEHAKVITALPLDEKDQEKMSERLKTLTGKKIVLETDVDPNIIGGFVARIGDKLIDGSTRSKLEVLKRKLTHAAI
jgi:F-type H+-transporting ATPase subunit delta